MLLLIALKRLGIYKYNQNPDFKYPILLLFNVVLQYRSSFTSINNSVRRQVVKEFKLLVRQPAGYVMIPRETKFC